MDILFNRNDNREDEMNFSSYKHLIIKVNETVWFITAPLLTSLLSLKGHEIAF